VSLVVQRTRMDLDHLEKVRQEWQSMAGPGRFDAKRTELDRLRAQWTESRDLQARKQREREDHRHSAALARYLDTFDIETGMPGIASSRATLLESFGIHTAADITTSKLEGVPNLDRNLRAALNEWRRGLEERFHRETPPGPDSLDEALIEREALAEQLRIEAALRGGLQDLREIQKQALFARVSMKDRVEEARNAYLQSAADLKSVTG
jgi:DNA-binding helix-hairpin-helix protein with protein kinase domain